jgi:hypothetical protein
MWFDLTGDARLGRCASEGCGGQPTFRLEADGVGSNYCSGCRERIEDAERTVVTCGMVTAALAAVGEHDVSLRSSRRIEVEKMIRAAMDWRPQS